MSRIHEPVESSKAMTALAAQVDRLSKRHAATETEVTNLQDAFRSIGEAVTTLATTPASLPSATSQPASVWEWLTIEDPGLAGGLLVELGEWLTTVWNHYGSRLPPCWPYHPAAVSELLATRAVWLAAIDKEAKPTALADWHERYRDGVARRCRIYIPCQDAAGGHKVAASPAKWTAAPDLNDVGHWWALTHGTTDDPTPGLERVP